MMMMMMMNSSNETNFVASNENGCFEIIYLNCQSFPPKLRTFRTLLSLRKPKVLMVSETRLTKSISDTDIEGYKLIRCDSDSRYTGGVAMFVDESLKHRVICSEISETNKTWGLCIKLLSGGDYLAVFYKSPQEKNDEFLNHLSKFCNKFTNNSNFVIIAGDANINALALTKAYKKPVKRLRNYLKELKGLGLQQIIDKPTRVSKRTGVGTAIDHVLTNKKKRVEWSINQQEKIGDHLMIDIKIFG